MSKTKRGLRMPRNKLNNARRRLHRTGLHPARSRVLQAKAIRANRNNKINKAKEGFRSKTKTNKDAFRSRIKAIRAKANKVKEEFRSKTKTNKDAFRSRIKAIRAKANKVKEEFRSKTKTNKVKDEFRNRTNKDKIKVNKDKLKL
eukprot:TRINITY_DN385_c0_g1_i2.p2 TRINITY_DN385_c0_g1~~TRINITY_DN385_c0_g1_i2.p2  ORF type:complete len:145 (+),score=38.63 TRINITY_DN385_c0_g1_i2:86-520(+)